jgi:hypothetical protein
LGTRSASAVGTGEQCGPVLEYTSRPSLPYF